MKVYVLTEGCYSAYHIIGVTLDEEQAKIAADALSNRLMGNLLRRKNACYNKNLSK